MMIVLLFVTHSVHGFDLHGAEGGHEAREDAEDGEEEGGEDSGAEGHLEGGLQDTVLRHGQFHAR